MADSSGPFEREDEARELPAVQAIYAAFDRDPGPGRMTVHTRAMLEEALGEAGVEAGAFDQRVIGWLSGFEPPHIAVICGWIARAHDAGRTEGEYGPGRAMAGGGWISGSCNS